MGPVHFARLVCVSPRPGGPGPRLSWGVQGPTPVNFWAEPEASEYDGDCRGICALTFRSSGGPQLKGSASGVFERLRVSGPCGFTEFPGGALVLAISSPGPRVLASRRGLQDSSTSTPKYDTSGSI